MIKIFLALVSVFAVLAVTLVGKMLMLPIRRARGLFAQKPASA